MGKLDGKVAIVTAGGQGIGQGAALELAKEGAAVVVAQRTLEKVIRVANEIKAFGGRALPVACDTSRRDQVKATVAAAVKEFGTVDILVNAAQSMRNDVLLEDTTDDDMALALGSGLMGTFYFMQECFPYMKQRGGKIINVGSGAGTEGAAGWAAYAAAKEGIRALTRVACHEWGKYKINVNVICPWADSPRFLEHIQTKPGMMDIMLMMNPLGRIGDCQKDIGRVVVFLASPDSDYITGHTIMVDGGQLMLR